MRPLFEIQFILKGVYGDMGRKNYRLDTKVVSGYDITKDCGVNSKRESLYITSIDVAHFYEKKHSNVLKKIHNFIKDLPQLGGTYYILDSYKDKNGQYRPMYKMNQKGFTLLMSKFTGKSALCLTYQYVDDYSKAIEQITNLMNKIATQSNENA